MKELEQFLANAERVLARVEALLPAAPASVDWTAATAFRWRVGRDGRGSLQPVLHPSRISLDDLHNIAQVKCAGNLQCRCKFWHNRIVCKFTICYSAYCNHNDCAVSRN